ncbi:hypothetical protein Bbelb_261260 [Branchiostoma belcheri]|nr:hypothetical protein Bbelb_261260 [Branchiostoma belcheri]
MTDPPASLAKTRPDTPTTGTTATTRTTTGTTATTRSKKAFHTIYLSSTRWTQMPIGTEAISGRKKRRSRRLVSPREDLIPQLQELQRWTQVPIGTEAISCREKRRSRLLASPRQDLIPQLQELQQLRVVKNLSYNIPFLNAVDSGAYRHRSDDKPRWTQVPIGTEAMTSREKRRSRPLALPKQDLIPQLQQLQELQQLRVADPPASLAKTRPDIPTTGTTGTTATTRTTTGTTATTRSKKPFIQCTFPQGCGLRCLSAQKRSEAFTFDASGTHWAHWYALVRTGRARTHWVHSYALGALIPGRHGEYVRIVSANNPARLDARRAIFVMSYMEHVPYACAASLGKQAVRVPEIRDAQPVAEKYTARSAALLSGCVHAGAAHPGHIRRGFRDGLHERSAVL